MATAVAQVWQVASGEAPQVLPSFTGPFVADCAYVVLTSAAENSQLSVWCGEAASKKVRQRAAKHASELVSTLDIKGEVAREAQGQESAAFKELWGGDMRYEAAAAQEGQVVAEERSSTQEQQGEAALAEGTAAPTVEPAAAEPTEAAPVAPESAAAAEAQAGDADPPGEQQPEAAAREALPAQPVAQPASPTKPASPAPAPAAASPAPPPAVASPAKAVAPASASPKAQAGPSPAKTPAAPAENGALEGAAAPKAEPAAAAEPKKVEPAQQAPAAVEEQPISPKAPSGDGEAVAKAREMLTRRLSGSFVDPLHQKKGATGSTTTQAGAATTYLADQAKVWGGAPGAAGAADAAELKFAPLKDFLPYEELKGMRAESGIDPCRKEDYLSEEEFAKVFGKDRAAFKALPAWRQQQAKKQVGLF